MRVLAKIEFANDKTKSKTPKKKEIKAQAKTGKKATEEAKVKTKGDKRKQVEKEVKPERREIEEAKKTEEIEPRQSTLFDFHK